VALLVKSSSRVRRSLETALERVLAKESFDGGIEGLRARISEALDDVLGPAVKTVSRDEGDSPPAPPPGEVP